MACKNGSCTNQIIKRSLDQVALRRGHRGGMDLLTAMSIKRTPARRKTRPTASQLRTFSEDLWRRAVIRRLVRESQRKHYLARNKVFRDACAQAEDLGGGMIRFMGRTMDKDQLRRALGLPTGALDFRRNRR